MERFTIRDVTPLALRYILPDDLSEVEKEAHSIDAKEVVEAIRRGKSVEIINAVIENDRRSRASVGIF